MPTYADLKENRRQFLATTSLTVTEFDQLVSVQTVYGTKKRHQ